MFVKASGDKPEQGPPGSKTRQQSAKQRKSSNPANQMSQLHANNHATLNEHSGAFMLNAPQAEERTIPGGREWNKQVSGQ